MNIKRSIYLLLGMIVTTLVIVLADPLPTQAQRTQPNCTGHRGQMAQQCNTLAALYNNTNGPNWRNKTRWLDTNSYCNWYGIGCDKNKNVTSIGLAGNKLSGSIPDWSALTSLENIYLHDNNLTGAIPDWSTLTKLKKIYFYRNRLSGSIPDWSTLTELKEINLSRNRLSGPIPTFANTNMNLIYLQGNKLGGPVPVSIMRTKIGRGQLHLRDNGLLTAATDELAAWLTARDPLWKRRKYHSEWTCTDRVDMYGHPG